MVRVANYITDAGKSYPFAIVSVFQTKESNRVFSTNIVNLIPPVIEEEYSFSKNGCELAFIPRRLYFYLQDESEYRFDIPFQPNTDKWALMLAQVKNDSRVPRYSIKGETIKANRLRYL